MRTLHALIISSGFICNLALAQTGDFRQLQLAYGISVDVPSHWTILSHNTRNNLQAAGRAVTENSGVDTITGRKENLLALNSVPEPTGAMVRISVTMPPEYSQSELAAATSSELKEVAEELLKGFRKMEASGGPKVLNVEAARIEIWNNSRVLVLPYRRYSKFGPSPWQVTQYKIPLRDRLVEITFSHRESDAYLWRPILDKVKRSARF